MIWRHMNSLRQPATSAINGQRIKPAPYNTDMLEKQKQHKAQPAASSKNFLQWDGKSRTLKAKQSQRTQEKSKQR